jgi:hypothetical protein
MKKYGYRFFAAQEQCDFPRLIQRMLAKTTFEGGKFQPKALWECMRRPLKTLEPPIAYIEAVKAARAKRYAEAKAEAAHSSL